VGAYSLPELPYGYGALEPVIAGEVLELHHAGHHAACGRGANDALERLAEAGALAGLEEALAFSLSGHALHSVLWQNLSDLGGGRPDGALRDAIARYFGSFDALAAQLTAATAGVQGSGWGVLGWEPLGRRLVVRQV